MRVIIDTNVLISGIFFKGPPYQILESWRNGHIKIVVSNSILQEYARTTRRISLKYPETDISSFFDLLTVKSEIVDEIIIPTAISSHKEDDKFLSCALSGKVPIIISGDDHLLRLHPFHKIEILSPSLFLSKWIRR